MLDFVATGQISELLLEQAPALIAVFDLEMRYLAVSRLWRIEYDLGERDITGICHYELFPEIPDRWRAIHRQILAGESLSSDVEPFPRADGTTDWLSWQMTPWRGHSGEVGGAILFAQKHNELVETRLRKEEFHATLDQMIDSARDYAISMVDTEGRFTFWSLGAERLYGWTAKEVLGQSSQLLFPPELRAREPLAGFLDLAAAREGTPQRAERMRKDGSRFMVDANLFEIRDGGGKLVGFTSVTRDITRELEMIKVQAESQARMRAILDTVPDAMITIDEAGLIESFSVTAERMFGYAADEVLGRNISMLMPEPEASRHDGYLLRYLSTGESQIVGGMRRVFGLRKDGTIFPHELHVGEANANGRRVFTGFVRDLTQRETGQRHLRELQSELSQIARVSAVGTMATALAHEINQPLTAIANYLQSAAELVPVETSGEGDLGQVRLAITEAGKEAIRAGQIINRLRQFISNGDLERKPVAIGELVEQACSLGFVGSDRAKISPGFMVEAGLPPILVDSVEIQQVLVNLIHNAIEAIGESGSVNVRVGRDGDAIRFSVIDDGPGIPSETIATLFNPLVTSKPTGMGLGLAICKTIVELHGGELWHEPADGGGAAFHFTIPILESIDA